jgi:hypothetical protein
MRQAFYSLGRDKFIAVTSGSQRCRFASWHSPRETANQPVDMARWRMFKAWLGAAAECEVASATANKFREFEALTKRMEPTG